MRTFVLTLFLFVFGIAQGQQLELKGTSYGAVTSAMYKEAKLKVAVTPQEFHELTLAYPELKIFFANRMDSQDCMLGYGSAVRWELTEEEKRNLRNFVKRNGGKIPKYRPLKSVSPSPISPAPEAEAKTTEVEKVEQEKVVLLETVESATTPINKPVRQIETEEELPQPLNKRSSREVLVTPPMKYEAGRLTMNGEGLFLGIDNLSIQVMRLDDLIYSQMLRFLGIIIVSTVLCSHSILHIFEKHSSQHGRTTNTSLIRTYRIYYNWSHSR